MNVFMRIGFGSAIKLASFDESQMRTINSFAVSEMVIAEMRVGVTTRSAAHMGSSSIGSERSDSSKGPTSSELEAREEAAKEALAIRISKKFALLEEVRPVLETIAYHDKYKKVLDEIWKDKVELDGMIVKEDEEAIKKVNENELADTGSDINTMPYWIYEQLGREEMKKVDKGITMINHTQAEAMGILTNVLCQVGFTTLIAKFLILDIPIDRDAPIVVGHGFLHTVSGIVYTPKRLFLTFDGFCHQTFHAARSNVMRNAESDRDDEEEYEIKRNKFGAPIYEIDDMLRIKLREAESNEEIFTFVAIRAFNIKEPIYVELCHKFYSTNEFDELCVDDELQSKKIIKFRLGERAHNLTLFEFARRLGLYHADELEDDGFNVYFQRGLRSDDHFNAHEYWLSIRREENLGLSRSHASTIRNPILRMIHKMITYVLCQRTTGPPRASIQDLYNRMGSMEIRQEAIERMEYRQSYHWDSLPSEWKTHTLIWRNKANLEEHSLDDLFNSLRI
nr:hypothetical protein [Tanacetum cinerariifolium]